MNCCDYDCNQGRNCPARVAPVGRRMPGPDPLTGPTWRDHLPQLACWMLVVIWMLVCFVLLVVGLV